MELYSQRSAKIAQQVKNAYVDSTVVAHWVAESSLFWYQKHTEPNHWSFVTVDAALGERRPSFDHGQLAKALNEREIEAHETALPFGWIELSDDGCSIRFRAGGMKWQFQDNRVLTEYDGKLNGDTLSPMPKEKASEATTIGVKVTFVNSTKCSISLLWIDEDGNPQFYAKVGAGKQIEMQTYVEHVWRVVDAETNEPIASFIAPEHDATAVIEDGMIHVTEIVRKDECSRLPDHQEATSETQQSRSQVFVRNYNVWLRDTDGREIQISLDGTKENPYAEKRYESPDSHYVIAWHYTPAQEHLVYDVESSPTDQVQPRLKQFQYSKPGDRVRIDRPRIFDLVKKTEVATNNSLFQNPFKIRDMGWSVDSSEYRFLYNQRGHQVLRVLGMNTRGVVRTIMEETSKTFIDYSQKTYYHEIKDTNEIVWGSERDGRCHLYLFDLKTGELKNRITEGKWVMRKVERIDEQKRQIWFTAYGLFHDQDPYYAQLARVDLDGSNLTVLTKGDGTHDWKWSPDRKYLIDTWSRVDLAPQTALRDGEKGRQVTVLEEGSLDKLSETGWTPAERFAAPGRDGGTMIYGIIIRPSTFESTKEYPIIEEIYAGPQGFFVPKAFSPLTKQHELAELGFIVVQIDGMGTNWRTKAFHDRCYKDLKDAGLPDRIEWITAAAKSRPWMDISRVGIYGGSAGGQSALGALLWHGDFYKVGIADCGCHDNRMDKLWWNEQWMGWPVDQAYEDSSNVTHAKNLKGALMLIVGELDTNVDPASTMQVVNALNEAGKDYDLLFMPGCGHGIGASSPYAIRRQRDFFVRHLWGVEPPKRNAG